MTAALHDLAPATSLEAITAQLRAHPEKPVVLYLSGVHADGSSCPACLTFEKTQRKVLAHHQQATSFAQQEIPLTYEAFAQLASKLGAGIDSKGLHDPRTGVNAPLSTPLLLQLALDPNGALEIKAARGGSGDGLDTWLKTMEKNNRVENQAREAMKPIAQDTSVCTASSVPVTLSLTNLNTLTNQQPSCPSL